MNELSVKNEDTVSKLNKILNDIQKTFNLKKNIKLYYVSEDTDIEGFIAIKYDNQYFKLPNKDSFGIKLGIDYYRDNPYLAIAGINQTIAIGEDIITDKEIIDRLGNLKNNETYLESLLNEELNEELNEYEIVD